MRLLTASLLAIALLIVGATSASAWRLDVTSNYDGVSTLGHSDTVTITLAFDTEGAADVVLLGIGVIYDTGVLAYNRGASSTDNYLLQMNTRCAYLRAANSCGGGYGSPNAGMGCSPHPTLADQVQVDFFSSQVGSNAGVGAATTGAEWLANLVFHVAAVGDGFGDIDITMDPIRSGILQLGYESGGIQPPLVINQAANATGVITPEPTTALLVGIGVLGLCSVSRRERAR